MISSIKAFTKAALERAEEKLSGVSSSDIQRFSVAGIGIGFVETEPRVRAWMQGQFDPATMNDDALIYCDYTNWKPHNTPTISGLEQISPLEMDNIFSDIGLLGNYDTLSGMWDIFDPELGIGCRLQSSADAHPVWETTAPLANFLAWVMRANGRHVLHAATVGIDGAGVLMVGAGGSGKSGTTLACVAAGLSSVGDDYCTVTLDKQITAQPFFRSMKQDASGMARVGLEQMAVDIPLNWQDKYVFDLRAVFPKSAVDILEIKAIIMPTVSHANISTFRSASQFEALQALAPSTMKQLSGDRETVFQACSELVRRLPCFHLSLSEHPDEISSALNRFIRQDIS